MRPAVFLDRDGTIIEDKGFLSDPAGVVLLPTVPAALRALRDAGFALVVISNQSGIGRGFFGNDAVEAVNAEIGRRLAGHGAAIDGWYWCVHAPCQGCACRKPETGLVLQAVEDLGLVTGGGAVIGDRGSDVELGHRLGMPGILLPTSYEYTGPQPDFRAATLLEAAQWVIARG